MFILDFIYIKRLNIVAGSENECALKLASSERRWQNAWHVGVMDWGEMPIMSENRISRMSPEGWTEHKKLSSMSHHKLASLSATSFPARKIQLLRLRWNPANSLLQSMRWGIGFRFFEPMSQMRSKAARASTSNSKDWMPEELADGNPSRIAHSSAARLLVITRCLENPPTQIPCESLRTGLPETEPSMLRRTHPSSGGVHRASVRVVLLTTGVEPWIPIAKNSAVQVRHDRAVSFWVEESSKALRFQFLQIRQRAWENTSPHLRLCLTTSYPPQFTLIHSVSGRFKEAILEVGIPNCLRDLTASKPSLKTWVVFSPWKLHLVHIGLTFIPRCWSGDAFR